MEKDSIKTQGEAQGNRYAAAIGTFDGCHKGHLEVLHTLISEARKRGFRPLAITFSRHPLEVVAPHKAPKMLSLPNQRIKYFERLECDTLLVDFDENVAATTAAQWLTMLRDNHNVRVLIIGYDNTFGADGIAMSVQQYVELGASLGIDVVQAPVINGISSSAIRKALLNGEIEHAAEMLGYPYRLDGIVVHGQELGRKLNAPTANLQPDPRLLIPAPGVYITTAITDDGLKHPAVVNIGNRPTLGHNLPSTIEVHILDFNKSLYSSHLTIEFLSRLRDQKKFDNIHDLSLAIQKDILLTKEYFNSHPHLLI